MCEAVEDIFSLAKPRNTKELIFFLFLKEKELSFAQTLIFYILATQYRRP